MNTIAETKVRLIASPSCWIEGEAVHQLYATARLEGVKLAVGFPDLHAGKGTAVGAAFVTEDVIYPHIIGEDIGCGMTLFKTDLSRRSAKRTGEWAELPFDIEFPWDGGVREFLAEHDLDSTEFDNALGTIGGGNHFAELQAVEQIVDAGKFKKLGIEKEQLVLLVHSGSRGLGERVLRDCANESCREGLVAESFTAKDYLRGHDFAVRWARANRALIAQRFMAQLGADAECVWDGCHNSITPMGTTKYGGRRARCPQRAANSHTVRTAARLAPISGSLMTARPTRVEINAGAKASLPASSPKWLHRKGAVAADRDIVVIPGSRGALTYIVKPIGDGQSRAWSLAHGAGRKWSRSESRLRMRERFDARELAQTALGGRVICEERNLLYEEAPGAYKKIEAVIRDLVDAGLVSVIATFRPLLTYKTRKLRR
jgi:release factor H-coupled RctB family protein